MKTLKRVDLFKMQSSVGTNVGKIKQIPDLYTICILSIECKCRIAERTNMYLSTLRMNWTASNTIATVGTGAMAKKKYDNFRSFVLIAS